MSNQIPILLLDLVLFPGMPLPLHIFEPRYRTMIQRCLDEDGVFGVALPLPQTTEFHHALPMGVGTSTRIIQVFPLPDGRFNLQTGGEQRFRVHSVQIIDDYPLAEIEWIEDAPPQKDLLPLARQVNAMAQKYFQGLAAETGLDLSKQPPIELPSDPYELSMWISAAMPMPAHEKQALLEQTSTYARLEHLLKYLQRDDLIRRAAIKQGIVTDQPFSWDPHASLN
jgi:Lon protease-like protein